MSNVQASTGTAPLPQPGSAGSTLVGADIQLMGPGDVLAYVTLALSNLSQQLNDYKSQVMAKQEKASDVHAIVAELREWNTGGNGIKEMDRKRYADLMSRLAKYPNDPQLKAAYEMLLKSYGGYTDSVTRVVVPDPPKDPNHDIDVNKNLNGSEADKVIKNVEESLSNLNSDNELLMLNLQTLMQQRNQISQLASNVLNSMNESAKGLIANLRP